MTPYGAVICQMANPRRRGEYASCLRFYLENDIPIYDMVSLGQFRRRRLQHHGRRRPPSSATPIIAPKKWRPARSRGWMKDEGWEIKFAPIDQFYVHIDLMVCMLNEHVRRRVPRNHRGRRHRLAEVEEDRDHPGDLQGNDGAWAATSSRSARTAILSTSAAKDLNANMRANGFTGLRPRR
jgi:hypothetical protein